MNDSSISSTSTSSSISPQVAPSPPPPPATLSSYAQGLAQLQYNHVEQQAALATTKASLLVTAHSIVFATYVTLAKDCSIFTSLKLSLAGIVFAVSGVLLVGGLLLALAAVYPRTGPSAREDILYFANVQREWPLFSDFLAAFHARDKGGNRGDQAAQSARIKPAASSH